MRSPISRALSRIILLLLIAAAVQAADYQELDRIVAVVGDDVILKSELDARLQEVTTRLEQQGIKLPPQDLLERQVLERLMEQRLQLAEAERLGIKVGDDTISAAVSRLAENSGLTLAEFRRTLEEGGVSFRDFREDVRRELLVGRLQAQEVVNRILVTDQEVESYLANEAGRPGGRSAYHLLHILVATPDGASPEEIAKAKAKAEQLVDRLRQGEDFREVALSQSDGQHALQGGDLGWLKPEELPSLLVETVSSLERGEISDPVRSASGFHIVKLEDYEGGSDQVIEQTHARHILIKTNELVSDQDARQRLAQLRARILGGDDFAALARSHSDDKVSAINGGDLGWVNPGDTVPKFEAQMKLLQPGEMSQPFHTSLGWHIVEVLDRRTHDSTAEVRVAEARAAIRSRKAKERIEFYVRGLRDQAYVDIRLDDKP